MKTHGMVKCALALGCIAVAVLPVQADLFVTSQTSGTNGAILRYNAGSGSFVEVFALNGPIQDPLGLAFGPDDNLYLASGNSGQILRYDGKTGEFMGVFASGGGLEAPINMTFGPDGNLYVSSSYRQILRYDGTTGAFRDAFISDNRLAYPRGLTFGPDGNLYVVSYNQSAVLRFSATTGEFLDYFVPSRSGGLFTPSDLAFGPDGNLYVTGGTFPDPGVFRFDGRTGEFIDQFASVEDQGSPIDLAFGPDRHLYVVTQGPAQGVLRFNGRTGERIDNFVTPGRGGLVNPFGIAFSPRRGPLMAIQIVDSTVKLEFPTEISEAYQVQYSVGGMSQWTNLGAPVAGTGAAVSVIDPVRPSSRRLYRVQLVE